MPKLRDSSSIPDNPNYWDALAGRVSVRADRPRASFWLAGRGAGWIAATTVAVAASLIVVVAARRGAVAASLTDLAIAVAPTDRVGRAFTARGGPPSVGELLIASAPRLGGSK